MQVSKTFRCSTLRLLQEAGSVILGDRKFRLLPHTDDYNAARFANVRFWVAALHRRLNWRRQLWAVSRLVEGKPPLNMKLKVSDDGCKLADLNLFSQSNAYAPPSGAAFVFELPVEALWEQKGNELIHVTAKTETA